jgi:hypothetical protein
MDNSINIDDFMNSPKIPVKYKSSDGTVDLLFPKVYLDKYGIISRDKKQFIEHKKEAITNILANDLICNEDKAMVIDTLLDAFWYAKALSKRK